MSDNHHSSIGMHGSGQASGNHTGAPRARVFKRARYAAIGVVVLLALGAAGTVIGRVIHMRDLRVSNETQARTYVNSATIETTKGGETMGLPGTLQGYIESPIYARTSGYVLHWKHDIGDRVQKGELLAELDTPEVDQQLAQAKATRAQSASSLELAKSSAERWESLRLRDAVSQQELDERRSAFLQARANLDAADANVQRLQHLEEFKRIVAPYAGVITRRNVDVGDLIDAGNGGSGRAMFGLSQTDPLRVYVYVPQSYATRVHVGQEVTVRQAELPEQVLRGTIRRTSGAIDAATRTLQVEVNLPNHDGHLLPGSYVEVVLPTGDGKKLLAPSTALLFRAEGTQVAKIDEAGHVHLQTVTIGRDFGQTIELLSGVQIGDHIILNPADSLAEGDIVSVRAPTAPVATTKEKS